MKSSTQSGYTAVPTYPPPPASSSSSPPLSYSGYATVPTYPSPPAASKTLPQYSPPPSLTAAPAPAPPTTTPAARVSSLVAQFKDQGKTLIATQKPWSQVLDTSALGRPVSAADALGRVRRNLSYFRSNYALAALSVFGLSLIWHPGSLFLFVFLAAAWFLLYFCRDQPLVLFNHPIDDGTVLVALTVATFVALLFTGVGSTIFGAIMVGLLLVGLHAAFRKTDDLYLDESEAANGGLVAGVGLPANGVPNQIYVRVM